MKDIKITSQNFINTKCVCIICTEKENIQKSA